MIDTVYDEDFVVWTERQAGALRRAAIEGSNLPIDWDHLAEEIEDLGREARHRVETLLFQTLVHLLKLACSPASDPRAGWLGEVDEFRRQLSRRLDDSPSLRARLPDLLTEAWPAALTDAARHLERHGEQAGLPALAAWRARGLSAAEVLADGLYPEPGTTTMRREPSSGHPAVDG